MHLIKLLSCSFGLYFLLSLCMDSVSMAEEINHSFTTEVAIPSKLHIYSPSEESIPVKIRTASIEEVQFLLRSNESDEPERVENYWAKNPTAYYRWDLYSGGDSGIISDIFKEVFMLAASGLKVTDDVLPRVVVASIDNEQRIVAFGTSYGTEVKFHSDFQLRKQGYKGIGTVIVADYLSWCLKNETYGHFTSVNNSYGFYEKIGFKYNTDMTPDKFENPSIETFGMELPLKDIPKVLSNLYTEDSKKIRTCGSIF